MRLTNQRFGAAGNRIRPVAGSCTPRLKYSGSSQCRWMPGFSDSAAGWSRERQIWSPVLGSGVPSWCGSLSNIAVRPAKLLVRPLSSALETRSPATFSGTIALTIRAPASGGGGS